MVAFSFGGEKYMTSTQNKIDDPRGQIDAIDAELLRLLNERAAIALRVGAAKADAEASLCDPRREQEVVGRLVEANAGPLDDQGVANIFGRIIDESLHLQQSAYARKPHITEATSTIASRSRVAILGERGTFSEEAALGVLDDDCTTVSCPTFEQLFSAIDDGNADLILTPLENSLIGSVHRCVDLLLASDLKIVAEIVSVSYTHLLRAVFHVNGTVTAGNSSQMSDGAAAAVVMSAGKAAELGIKPLARFISFATAGCLPEEMGIGPVYACLLYTSRCV